jgi:hypothetical protein
METNVKVTLTSDYSVFFSAVYFEQKDYDKCIEVSEEAITIGRENRADYTLIAK